MPSYTLILCETLEVYSLHRVHGTLGSGGRTHRTYRLDERVSTLEIDMRTLFVRQIKQLG